MKRYSISTILAALFAGILLPIALFLIILLFQLQYSEMAELERRTVRNANAVSIAVQPSLAEMVTTLKLVSSAKELRDGNLALFHEKTREALEGTGNYIIIVDQAGQQLLNTRVAFETPLGQSSNLDGIAKSLEAGSITVSDVFMGKTSDRWVFNVIIPLPQSATSSARAAISTKNVSDLNYAFEGMDLATGWQVAIIDQEGKVIASKGRNSARVGEPLELSSDAGDRFDTAESGIIRFEQGGINHITGIARVGSSGWRALTWGPVHEAQNSILTVWNSLIWAGLAFTFFTVCILYLFSRYFNRSIRNLAHMASEMGEGAVVSPVSSRIAEINLVGITLSEASYDRSQREETIKYAMRELAHRTKNLMAVIMAMVRQTSRQSGDVKTMAASLASRVTGLGQSIDLLTQKEWRNVPLSELVRQQTSNFAQSIEINGPDVLLRAEAVQHLGMALHELSTNAVKHGALSTPKGRIKVQWNILPSGDDDMLVIEWIESLGPRVKKPRATGFGTQILDAYMASSFNGTPQLMYDKSGFKWRLEAPLRKFVEERSS